MSTFELFTKLPLFKELEMDALLSLVPKINLDFEHSEEGSVLFAREMPVNGMVFLLHGAVRLLGRTGETVVTGPALLCGTGIFGTIRTHDEEALAQTACSILTVDKRSLTYLIRTEPAFLEAYLGLLSDALYNPTSH
jgi:signal-transduction protein with cAMP-binding, CBS, and nucleotidyltransferase domain